MTNESLICDRCSAVLTPGQGDFYVVRIQAVADPTPPTFSAEDLEADIGAEIDRLVESLEGISEAELNEQVFARRTLHLCRSCYLQWIDNPAGGE